MHPSRSFLFGSLLAASLGVSPAALADVPPTCSEFDSVVTCSAGVVGQPCTGGGTCYEVYCSDGPGGSSGSENLYKCETCPAVLDADAGADAGACTGFGESCADGRGECQKLPEWCPQYTGPGIVPCVELSDAGSGAHSDGGGSTSPGDGGGTAEAGPGDAGGTDGGTGDAGGTLAKTEGSSAPPSSGGCSASPGANRGWFAAGLGLVGVIALGLGRRRRSRA
jgi:MYXO-CTERM domain-containing protein